MKGRATVFTPTLAVLLGSLLIFVFSSKFPMGLLNMLVGNKIGATFVILGTLLVLRTNIVLGLAVFLAAGALFLEHRRRIVIRVQEAMRGAESPGAPVEVLSVPAPDLIRGEKHPDAADHSYEDYSYEPSSSKGGSVEGSHGGEDNEAAAAADAPRIGFGESVNDKAPLGTVPPRSDEVGDFFQQRGLAPRPMDASNSF